VRITNQTLQTLRTDFQTQFQTAYDAAVPRWDMVASRLGSSTGQNTYGFALKTIKMREWLGERVLQNLAETQWTIANRDFEGTVAVDRNDILDDNLGIYNVDFSTLGQAARMYPDNLVFDLFRNGQANLCFDGQFFFDTDHPVSLVDPSLGVYVNYATGRALTVPNYEATRAEMMAYRGDDGEPLEVMPNLLVVPPQLEGVARRLLNADLVASGDTNVWKGSADLLVVPKLASQPTAWYLLDVTRPIKPFLFQERQAPVFVAKDNPEDDNVFFLKQFVYGADARGNSGYTLPFLAYKAVG
jgi:phage major head subunit gpT-like protein